MIGEANQAATQRFLEATAQTVAWFWKRADSNELELSPPFQRNPVWQDSQKAYLIDTILRGYPVPELYLQYSISSQGVEKHTVVDGQQRIRACIEYISGGFSLGDESEEYAGLYFDQLTEEAQQQIWSYKFIVRSLPPLSQGEIREIFGRLNRNNVALNKQELRQATYWGDFISCMNELTQMEFWVKSGLFTTNDIRRMLDVEFVSELAVGALYGPQNKKASLDKYYAAYEAEFPDRDRLEGVFESVLSELSHILKWPNRLRWSRKVDFYTLFLILASRADELPLSREAREAIALKLVDFSDAVKVAISDAENVQDGPLGRAARSYSRGVRNSSDSGSRRLRIAALESYLWDASAAEELEDLLNESSSRGEGVAGKLPTMEELYDSVPEEEEEEEEEEE
ncbi:DUF262 domain-containing protein [Streptomyces shenzhenensis]|uniref:DUF262 domain-containing protein n=1 Tax=Streptomyces shenzhenensis TaxID=943815 RepID=UPI0015F070F2|nr:DUF262 domain-containing protein [Streptomyces shenzhenensis]